MAKVVVRDHAPRKVRTMHVIGEGAGFNLVGRKGTRPEALHRELAAFNRQRLEPAGPDAQWRTELATEVWPRTLEGEFLEAERGAVIARAATAPAEPEALVRWFEGMRE